MARTIITVHALDPVEHDPVEYRATPTGRGKYTVHHVHPDRSTSLAGHIERDTSFPVAEEWRAYTNGYRRDDTGHATLRSAIYSIGLRNIARNATHTTGKD